MLDAAFTLACHPRPLLENWGEIAQAWEGFSFSLALTLIVP